MNEIVKDILVDSQMSGRNDKVRFDNVEGLPGVNNGVNDESRVNCHDVKVREMVDWSIGVVVELMVCRP